MSDAIAEWYRATKKMIKKVQEDCEGNVEPIQHMIDDWNQSLETMEAACPGIKEQYERRHEVKQSFTEKQIDHICYMIGEWYVEWKGKMWVDGKPNQHRLGIAKEKLKTMICGDKRNYREYLGDGLYGDFDGYQIVLAANNGIRDTNVVYLEPEVLKKFFAYIESIEQIKKQHWEKDKQENE